MARPSGGASSCLALLGDHGTALCLFLCFSLRFLHFFFFIFSSGVTGQGLWVAALVGH